MCIRDRSRAKRKKFFFDYFTNFWVGPHLNEKFLQIDLRDAQKKFFDYFTDFWVGPHLNRKFLQIDLRKARKKIFDYFTDFWVGPHLNKKFISKLTCAKREEKFSTIFSIFWIDFSSKDLKIYEVSVILDWW